MNKPTLEYKNEEKDLHIIEYRWTKFVCSNFHCRYSKNAEMTLLLNPIDKEKLVCRKCGSKLTPTFEKDFIERFERKIW